MQILKILLLIINNDQNRLKTKYVQNQSDDRYLFLLSWWIWYGLLIRLRHISFAFGIKISRFLAEWNDIKFRVL